MPRVSHVPPWRWGAPGPGAAKLLSIAGKRREFESLQQEAAIKPNIGLPLLSKKASFSPPERMNRFLLVWAHFKQSVEALPGFDLTSSCELNMPAGTMRSPGLILVPVLRALLLGCFKAHPEDAGFTGEFSV